MKCTGLICLVALLLGVSCSKEVDYGIGEYKVDWVKVLDNNHFMLLNQTQDKLVAVNAFKSINNNDRILLNYTVLADLGGGEQSIRINGGTLVLCDTVTSAESTLGKDLLSYPLTVETAWLGQHYLNITAVVDVRVSGPVVALVCEDNDEDGCTLRFVYDKKTDAAGTRNRIYCSFDLSKLLGPLGQDKTVLVHFDDEKNPLFEFKY